MDTGLFISKRLIRERRQGTSFSRPINVITITGIGLGLAVMIVALAILTGFKQEIRNKIVGFGGHIQVINYDGNNSYETVPISSNQEFTSKLEDIDGFRHIQVFATKAGIIKTDDNIQGVVLKGVDSDYNWSFFENNMVEGSVLKLNDTIRSDGVIISKIISEMLGLKLGDKFAMFFVQDPPRMRSFTVMGIYETSVEEMDKIFVLCDIAHIRRLNGWTEDQVSGFEILIDRFNDTDYMSYAVQEAVGHRIFEDQDNLKVTNIGEKYPQIFDWVDFQDTNVIIILILMLLVAGFNMISGLLILILEKTNMIGILKALGSDDKLIRKIFIYQSAYLIGKGLLFGNIIGIGIAFIQEKFSLISLNPDSYYLTTVPIQLDFMHLILLNMGTMIIIILMLLIPSKLISRISPVKAIQFE